MLSLAFRSATALARDIQAGRTTARALLELCLARVDRHNPAINAVVVQDRDAARQRADAADAAQARGECWGPLHGVPMTVKESFDLPGLPTTWGHPWRRGHAATGAARVVQRLIDAGAVVYGKTNVPVDLADFQSYNEVYGTTNNPWTLGETPGRTPGGSSGGSAAALAAGFSALEMGSDIGGSIRNPAHFCGVFGHKPSWGLLSSYGHTLGDSRTPVDLAVVGPLARSAADLELALRLTAGPDHLDAAGVAFRLPALSKPLTSLRVAVWHSDPICPSSAAVAARVQAVASALASSGAQVLPDARPAFTAAHSHAIYGALLQAALGARGPHAMADARQAQVNALAADDTSERARVLRDQSMSLHRWTALDEQRALLRQAWHDFFSDHDFMVTPIMPTSAFVHDHGPFGGRTVDIDGRAHPYFSQTFWAGLAGVALLPATIIPTGPDDHGRPIGVQIIGPMWGDLQTIQLAQQLERMGFAFQAPPGLDD